MTLSHVGCAFQQSGERNSVDNVDGYLHGGEAQLTDPLHNCIGWRSLLASFGFHAGQVGSSPVQHNQDRTDSCNCIEDRKPDPYVVDCQMKHAVQDSQLATV